MDELTEAEREALGIWDDGSYACANDDYTCERCDPQRDHESLLAAVARIKADAHAAGVAEGRAEVAARVEALADRADLRVDIDRRLVTTIALRAALAGTSPQGGPAEESEDDLFRRVTDYPLDHERSRYAPHDYRDDATAIGDSTGFGGPVGGGDRG